MPRNLFVLELKKSDVTEPATPVSQERASVPAVPVAPRPVAPTAGKPWPGSGERRGGRGKGGHAVDARRRRSGASRFRG